jgi:predicted cupin superfamily sugar epimerase
MDIAVTVASIAPIPCAQPLIGVMVFSLEMPKEQLAHRMVASEGRRSLTRDRKNELQPLECERMVVGPLADGAEPVRVIPAGHWQAARTTGNYTLVTCAVGPGFDFADFTMLADHPTEAEQVRRRFSGVAPLV